MEWLINNWYLIVAAGAVVGAVIYAVRKFLGLPTEQQLDNLKEWLKWAVTQAEKELGSGTGQLKLRMAVGEFDAVQPVAADEVRHAGNVGILVDRHFTASVQFQLFEVTGTHAGDFAGQAAEIHFIAETAFRIAQGPAAVQIVGTDPAEFPLHDFISPDF